MFASRFRRGLPAPLSVLSSLLGALLLSAACLGTAHADAPRRAPAAPVDAAMPSRQSMPHQLHLVGSLHARQNVDLASQIAGQVTALGFRDGEVVEKDQPLIVLDEDVYRAEFRQAQASFELAQLRHRRSEQLLKQKAIAQSAFDESRAELEERRAALELAQVKLDKTTIRAPFSGRAGIANISVGDYVTAGQPLVSLVTGGPIQLDFQVPERVMPHLRVGAPVSFTVDSLGGEHFEAQVIALEPRFDQRTRSLRARAELPNPDNKLRPGMFARLVLTLGDDEPVVTVPEEALMPSRSGYRLYEIVDGIAHLRAVTTGVRAGGRVAVLDGIDGSRPVVVTGQLRLADGTPVEVRQQVDLIPAAHPIADAGADRGKSNREQHP